MGNNFISLAKRQTYKLTPKRIRRWGMDEWQITDL